MMLSTCPSCLNQISHQESVAQVSCECGEKFSPFMRPQEFTPELEDVSIGTPKFAESEAAFQEIRDFGDSLEATPTPSSTPLDTSFESNIEMNTPLEEINSGMEPTVVERTPIHSTGGNALITTAQEIPGYHIETYLLPISLLCPLSEGGESPLDEAFQKVWEKAQQLGANAIIDLKWKIFPDGTRVLMTATPVTCQKV